MIPTIAGVSACLSVFHLCSGATTLSTPSTIATLTYFIKHYKVYLSAGGESALLEGVGALKLVKNSVAFRYTTGTLSTLPLYQTYGVHCLVSSNALRIGFSFGLFQLLAKVLI